MFLSLRDVQLCWHLSYQDTTRIVFKEAFNEYFAANSRQNIKKDERIERRMYLHINLAVVFPKIEWIGI